MTNFNKFIMFYGTELENPVHAAPRRVATALPISVIVSSSRKLTGRQRNAIPLFIYTTLAEQRLLACQRLTVIHLRQLVLNILALF